MKKHQSQPISNSPCHQRSNRYRLCLIAKVFQRTQVALEQSSQKMLFSDLPTYLMKYTYECDFRGTIKVLIGLYQSYRYKV